MTDTELLELSSSVCAQDTMPADSSKTTLWGLQPTLAEANDGELEWWTGGYVGCFTSPVLPCL